MSSKLGEAFLAIIPKVDASAMSGVMSSITSTLGGVAKTGAAAFGAVGAAATVAAGVLVKSSLDGYAAYEQNVGGIQKLFGNMGKSLDDYASMTGQTTEQASGKWQELEVAQTKAMSQAKQAFATCGLSANAYMEQVTSFSAALITSLGGDTGKAADYANMAMVDMSDNVNTFGSSMQDVQNAYQGFAKQNYTMLDNLKLGYGGTQKEMQRLIKDASKMTDVQRKLGVTVDSSSMSFDNIVAAIHVMQESMQIGGTTAREAATTIEGSVSQMRAAWENWVTALGEGDAGWLAEATDDLADSLVAVAGNVLPRVATIVSNIISELPGLVEEVGPTLADALTTVVGSAAEVLRAAVPEQFRGVFDSAFGQASEAVSVFSETLQGLDGTVAALGWGGALKVLLADVAQAFGVSQGDAVAFAGAVSDTLTPVVEGAVGFLRGLADGAASLLGSLSELAGPVADLGSALGGVLGEALQRAGELLGGLAAQAGDVLVPALRDNLVPACQSLLEAIQPWLEPIANVADAFGNILVAAITIFVDALSLVIQIISEVVVSVQMLAEGVGAGIDGIVGFFSQLPGTIAGLLGSALATIGGFVSSVGSSALQAGGQFLQGISSGFSSAVSFVAGIPGRILGALGSVGSLLWNAGSSIVQGLLDGIKSAIGGVYDFVSGIAGKIASLKGPIPYDLKLLVPNGMAIMESLHIGLERGFGPVADLVGGFADSISSELSGAMSVPDAGVSRLATSATLARSAVGGAGWSTASRQTVVNQTFSTKVVRADADLYAAAPTIYRNAMREARAYA